ncbi:MAG TPA: TerB family tellurite resistance protein [Rhodospirillales bacterium]|nr:TerB family tellurite resistance protein [Rhodospirillales bacterium]
MIKKLKALLDRRAKGGPSAEDNQEALRLATAALLMDAACMDGHIDDQEQVTITALLIDQFDLDQIEAQELAEAGRQAASESAGLYKFTRTIKDNFDHEDRVRMIEMLWRVAYADGILHDYEASLVRRVCGLIYVSDPESGLARKRVLEQLDLHPTKAP